MSMRPIPFLAIAVLMALALLSACANTVTPLVAAEDAPTSQVVVEAEPTPQPASGLVYDLSVGADQPPAAERNPLAIGAPLDEADAQKILNRLPAFEGEDGDVQDFRFPAQSLPAPRPGVVVKVPFPAPVAAEAPATEVGPLEVLRYAPEGDVPLAANLSVTFNQPMVALTGLADLAKLPIPVKLSPQPAGQWRWVGTKTLVFEPLGESGSMAAGRFPMATAYTVEIPAGTTSATGGKLANAGTFTFTTPAPQVQAASPQDKPTRRDPLIFVSFDQRIDPQAVLKTIQAAVEDTVFPLRLATDDEIAADEAMSRLTKRGLEGRWLVFRPVEQLSADSQVTITVGPGTPSLEGSLTTTKPYTFSFRTYGPLRVVEQRCGWGDECAPFTPWSIRFSNPLDAATVTAEQLTITPSLPGATVNVWGDTLLIQGRSEGRTTYTVRVGADIKDVFGQSLGHAEDLTFAVGSSQPMLSAPGGSLIVLDPMAKPVYTVYSVNFTRLSVRAYAVTPDDWQSYLAFQRDVWRQDRLPTPPGRRVLSKTVNVESRADRLAETSIDLSSALPDGLGHIIVVVEPERDLLPSIFSQRGYRAPVLFAWIQGTRIGLDAFVDQGQMLAWANDLRDGAPLKGVELALSSGGAATTAADGTATLPLPAGKPAQMLIARQGNDTAFLPQNTYYWGADGGWQQQPLTDALRWYVFDDRGIYRPGEEVHVKGWLRVVGAGPRGDIAALDDAARTVAYSLQDARGNQVLDGSATLNALGGFDFSLTLPDNINLGATYLTLEAGGLGQRLDGTSYQYTFQVQEFRRPEYEVKAAVVSPQPHIVGGGADLEVSAAYYAGGALPNADVMWNVISQRGSYSPPGWDDFTFGRWTPWWSSDRDRTVESAQTITGTTDAAGIHRLHIDFRAVDPPEPSTVSASVTVMDVNRQAWTSQASVLVHPASLYVGLRTDRFFVERTEPIGVDIIVADLDGKAVAEAEVKVVAERLVWRNTSSGWREEPADSQTCTVTSAAEPARCTFETPEGGAYRITAAVLDEQGRPNQTQITRWVSGGDRRPQRNVEQEEVTLIPDKQEYRAGETAEILVQAPFYPAEGLLTLRRSGLVRSERFTVDGPSYTLHVPIEDAFVPNIYVQVDLVGAAERTGDAAQAEPGTAAPTTELPRRPALASGELNLSVPPLARTLTLEVEPLAEKLEPGGSTEVDVLAVDAAGQPVANAELAVAVVDEAILALTGYDVPDPITTFYSERWTEMSDYHSRPNIILASPDQLDLEAERESPAAGAAMPDMAMAAPAPTEAVAKQAAMEESAAEQPGAAIAVRQDFNPLAHWSPAVATDAEGRARVIVKLPDNLTRYRVIVVAVAGGREFGKGQAAITARLPLMVRPSPPRFLNFGDQFELPVVLQNQTDEPLTVDVALRATNVGLADKNGRRVTVPANDRVEVRFAAFTEQAGTARFQVAATAGKWADAASFALPVYTPATTEAFAVYGVLDEGAVAQPVIAPTGVFTQFGGLEITTSSTALQALTDAVLYLVSYPFECSEQLASRILAVAALRDVLTAFEAEGLPLPAQIEAAVARDIERLRGMQNPDGGFPIWVRGYESWPYHSIHVANALQRARMKGYDVPQQMLDLALKYLQDIESHYPSWYSDGVRQTLTAYALNVRAQMGDRDAARARQIIAEVGLEKLSPEAIGFLLPVLSDDAGSQAEVAAIRRHLLNRVTETAGAAHFVADYRDQGYVILASSRRADGILLDALIQDQPDSDLIPKLVTGLLGQRKAGRWSNTQENSFILLALDRYFNTYEAQTPDFVARIWLGEQYAGEAAFRGRTTEYQRIDVPMAVVAEEVAEQENLIISKDGPGRLYYRLGMRYAPQALNLPPYEAGFTVERAYEGVDNADDVTKDADGVWHVRAGARVRVRLTMVAPATRFHVALVDPLPAGLEALNPALAVTGPTPEGVGQPDPRARGYYWWWRPWYEHQNLRDQRVEAFASYLWGGVYEYTYVARATTPGAFVVPPAKAEEMYAPETFGRTGVDRLIVE